LKIILLIEIWLGVGWSGLEWLGVGLERLGVAWSGLEWTLRNGISYFYPRFFRENGLVWGLLSGELKDVLMGKFSNKTAVGVGWSGLERILLIPVFNHLVLLLSCKTLRYFATF